MQQLDMDVDYSLGFGRFCGKYCQDFPAATEKELEDAYNKYKDFYAKYHQNNRGATTDCYEEYLKTKQGKRRAFIGRIEEQRGEEFEYCYWFCAILQSRQSRRY